jgi:hypothetical protein
MWSIDMYKHQSLSFKKTFTSTNIKAKKNKGWKQLKIDNNNDAYMSKEHKDFLQISEL